MASDKVSADDAGVEALADRAFMAALPLGLPLFPEDVQASTPLTASPYWVTLERFAREFAFNRHRQAQLAALGTTVRRVRDLDCEPLFLVTGGSYLIRARERPKDLDCALFFRGKAREPAKLKEIQLRARPGGLDLRLLPFDVQPALAAKMVGYFTLLYAQKRDAADEAAVLVVDLAGAGGSDGAGERVF